MRHYEVNSGERWTASHPVWKEKMRNKDGSVKKRNDKRLEAELVQRGDIRLVPSVTTVTGIADLGKTDGLISWIKREAIECSKDGAEGFAERLEERTTGAAVLGDSLHAAVEGLFRGETPTGEKEIRFCAVAKTFLEGTFWEGVLDHLVAEEKFANLLYGGTIDVYVPPKDNFGGAIVDWKTTNKKKPISMSYKLQAIAYGHQKGVKEAYIVQYNHVEGEISQVLYLEPTDFDRLTPLVYDLFTLYNRLSTEL